MLLLVNCQVRIFDNRNSCVWPFFYYFFSLLGVFMGILKCTSFICFLSLSCGFQGYLAVIPTIRMLFTMSLFPVLKHIL